LCHEFAVSGFWTLIIDYSFLGINDETVKLSPTEAMQFGRALERLLFRIWHANPRFGPTYMAKIDLAYGFDHLLLATHIPNLGVVFPSYNNKEALVAFPLALLMGWIESPPCFLPPSKPLQPTNFYPHIHSNTWQMHCPLQLSFPPSAPSTNPAIGHSPCQSQL
jgi:hypothetical protein